MVSVDGDGDAALGIKAALGWLDSGVLRRGEVLWGRKGWDLVELCLAVGIRMASVEECDVYELGWSEQDLAASFLRRYFGTEESVAVEVEVDVDVQCGDVRRAQIELELNLLRRGSLKRVRGDEAVVRLQKRRLQNLKSAYKCREKDDFERMGEDQWWKKKSAELIEYREKELERIVQSAGNLATVWCAGPKTELYSDDCYVPSA